MAAQYLVIGSAYCGFCTKAKDLLESNDIEYTYADMKQVNQTDREQLQAIAETEFQTVPQIFKYRVGGGLDYIGGYTELAATF